MYAAATTDEEIMIAIKSLLTETEGDSVKVRSLRKFVVSRKQL